MTNFINKISDDDLFKQAILAMEQRYGRRCEEEIDAYFRGAKWMQEQYNKQDKDETDLNTMVI